MKLLLDPDVKRFLKNNKILTEEDLIEKMHEEFTPYPRKHTIVSTKITKNSKDFSVIFATNENGKDVNCISVSEIIENAMTLKEYALKRKKEGKNKIFQLLIDQQLE
ncbi:MAG TPA: hypothetical protein GXX15_00005 [Clostridia bacterium]|nr:hypothetical protein [Clostridia bacterium]